MKLERKTKAQLIEEIHSLEREVASLKGTPGSAGSSVEGEHRISSAVRYERIASDVPGVVYQYVQRMDGTKDVFPFISAGVQQLYGLEPGEVMENSDLMWSAIHPDDVPGFADSIKAAVENGTKWNREWRIKSTSGETKWVKGTASQDWLDDGSLLWDGLLLDITDLKLAEEKYRNLFDNAEVGMYRAKLDGSEILAVNQKMCDIMGRSKEEMIGGPAQLHWEDPADREEMVRLVSEQGFVRDHEIRVLTKSGEIKTCLFSAKVDESRDFIEGSLLDISERKLVERELELHRLHLHRMVDERTAELQESELRLAVEAAATAQIVTCLVSEDTEGDDPELKVLHSCMAATGSTYGLIGSLSEEGRFDVTTFDGESSESCAFPPALAWEMTTGMTVRGVLGWPLIHGQPLLVNDPQSHPEAIGLPDGHVPIDCFLGVPIENGEKVEGMVAVANKAGGYTEADQETLARLVKIMHMGREYRNALKASQISAAELQEKVRERTEELESFAYSVSHDLRAPLRAVEGLSQALLKDYPDQLDEKGKRFLSLLSEETQRMDRLIIGLLKLSRVTRTDMRMDTVDLSALVNDSLWRLAKETTNREIQTAVQSDVKVTGDRQLLRQAVDNLVENAWKFTSKTDRPRIEFGAIEENGDKVYFLRDNGVGFEMESYDKLFTPFQRLHRKKDFDGTGIGLSTVKRIIQRHAGRVWLVSEPGEGTTAHFTLNPENVQQQP